MSEYSTRVTQELILNELPRLARVTSEAEAIEAYRYFNYRSVAVNVSDTFDHEAVKEIADENAEVFDLHSNLADMVVISRRRPVGQSLAAMHGPSGMIWENTGSCLVTRGTDVVHYIAKPGMVEQKYGPAHPYILDKLAGSILTRALGWELPDVGQGYSNLKALKIAAGLLKPDASMHIGATSVEVNGKLFHGSASGILPASWHDAEYQKIPAYAERAETDKAAGLWDWRPDLRAGMYDVLFAEQVITALNGRNLEGSTLKLVDPSYYEGVDIN